MSKRREKAHLAEEKFEESMEELGGLITATSFPVMCAGENCERRTMLVLPGDGPYEGGVFAQKGWTAVSDAERGGGVAFLCDACFKREVKKGELQEQSGVFG